MNQFFGKWCSVCKGEKTHFNWCRTCNAKHFQQNFKNWTSDNNTIDNFIQEAQLLADEYFEVLEWIPYDRFFEFKFIAKGGFGSVSKARWIDGPIRNWDDKKQGWERLRQNDFVALKSLDDSTNITSEFIREITCHKNLDSASIIKLYGITQDPKTKNYMMVLEYAENGSLRNYLDKNNNLSWEDKIRNMHYIALGLSEIHKNRLIHRDLHIGNILIMTNEQTCITDMGLCRPASDKSNSLYGVISYIAPEVLSGKSFTEAADIYSFGIIMYEIISGLRPHSDRNGDNLVNEVWRGLRPKFNIKVPKLIQGLYDKCLDGNHLKRPKASEIAARLGGWLDEINLNKNNSMDQSELTKQIKEADKANNNSPTKGNFGSPSNSKNNGAVYHSRKISIPNSKIITCPNNDIATHSYSSNLLSKFSEINFDNLDTSVTVE